MRRFNQIVSLVGENPLPIYLAIRQFASPAAELILIYTPKTAPVSSPDRGNGEVERLEKRLKSVGFVRVETVRLPDAYDPASVNAVMTSLWDAQRLNEDAALNYTGGTKVMSAFSLLAWWAQKKNINNTVYLEDERRLFHLGDGSTEDLKQDITLEDLLALHMPTHGRNASSAFPTEYTPQDLTNILNAFLYVSPEFVWRLRFDVSGRQRPWGDLKPNQQRRLLDGLRVNGSWTGGWKEYLNLLTEETRQAWEHTEVPASNDTYEGAPAKRIPVSELFKQFRFFVHHGWMEMLARDLLASLPASEAAPFVLQREQDAPRPRLVEDIVADCYFKIGGQEFQSDVLCVVRQRLRYVSVTTARNEAACKEKMFEALERARQIGGGLAGTCVISLADDETVKKCRASLDIKENDRRALFGADDLMRWLDGDIGDLRTFLTC
jgi:hypothetical protein